LDNNPPVAEDKRADAIEELATAQESLEKTQRSLGWLAMPHFLRDFVDWLMGPITYFVLSVVLFIAFLYFRDFLTAPLVAWTILIIVFFFAGGVVPDPNFCLFVTKEDIFLFFLLFLGVVFFPCWAFGRGVVNDKRLAGGAPPAEKAEEDKVLVWP